MPSLPPFEASILNGPTVVTKHDDDDVLDDDGVLGELGISQEEDITDADLKEAAATLQHQPSTSERNNASSSSSGKQKDTADIVVTIGKQMLQEVVIDNRNGGHHHHFSDMSAGTTEEVKCIELHYYVCLLCNNLTTHFCM